MSAFLGYLANVMPNLLAMCVALGVGIGTAASNRRQRARLTQHEERATSRFNGYTDLIADALDRVDHLRQEVDRLRVERADLRARLAACEEYRRQAGQARTAGPATDRQPAPPPRSPVPPPARRSPARLPARPGARPSSARSTPAAPAAPAAQPGRPPSAAPPPSRATKRRGQRQRRATSERSQ